MPTTIRRKLLWLIATRAVVVTVLLGSAVLIEVRAPGSLPSDGFFRLLGLTFALTAIFSATIRYAENHRWLADLQLLSDALVVTAIVAWTGGINSYFSSLYVLPIIAASVIRSWRGGMLVATGESLAYAAIVIAQYARSLSSLNPEAALLPDPGLALYRVGLNVFGFYSVAALTGYLAEGLRSADAQLQRASSELADMQAFSRHVVDSLTSGLATTDTTGRVMTFNRAGEAITGLRTADVVGTPAVSALQLPASLNGLFGPAEGRPKQTRVEFDYRRPDGREIEIGLSTAPLMTPRGETGFILTFQDVTEARKLEREARVQQRLAAVGEMAAGIAHEIRNPLASMSGSIQILRGELPLTDEQGQLMDIVIRESERLNDTIRSFLSYARPQRQAMKHMDVRQLITDAATLLQHSAERGEQHRIATSVPDEPVWLQADEGQIRQIVWNLATNGLRAMPDGGTLTLAVTAPKDAPGQVVLAVSDEGVGIAPEDIDGIFQPFRGGFQRGTGLGLSIVHRIVSDYAGEVQVTSAKNAGTTVYVKFPAAAGSKDEAATLELGTRS